MRISRFRPAVLLAALVFLSGAAGANTELVIVAGGPESLRRLGPYRYFFELSRNRSYRAAVAAFGRPSSHGTDAPGSNVCTVRWRRLALDIGFAGGNGCTAANLRRSAWYGASIHSRRWRTNRGLRIGDSTRRLRALYPSARFHDRPPQAPFWSVIRERGEFGTVHALKAIAWAGRIVAFEIPANYVY